MLLASLFKTPCSLSNVEAIATFTGDLVYDRLSFAFFLVHAFTIRLVSAYTGAFATSNLLDIFKIFNATHDLPG